MTQTPAMKTLMATYYTSLAAKASLHVGDPGTTGANELTGGSYARQNLTGWALLSPRLLEADPISFSIPADTDVYFIGIWKADSTFLDSQPVSVSFVSAGVYAPTIRAEQVDP